MFTKWSTYTAFENLDRGTKSTYRHPFCCIVRLVYLNSSLWEHKVECYKCLSRLLPRCKVDHQVLVCTRKIRMIVLLLLHLAKDRPASKHLHYIKCWWIANQFKTNLRRIITWTMSVSQTNTTALWTGRPNWPMTPLSVDYLFLFPFYYVVHIFNTFSFWAVLKLINKIRNDPFLIQ